MILTGEFMGAQEALHLGLVSRVVPKEECLESAIAMGQKISTLSKPIGNNNLSKKLSIF